MISANVRDENGESYIPASQRPDGTWRKARRVKEGYVPQEEVPLYESKGKQFLNRQVKSVTLPVGTTAHHSIPGLFITEEKDKANKNKKKQTKKTDTVAKQINHLKISEPLKSEKANPIDVSAKQVSEIQTTQNEVSDPAKKLRNLKKRLREVEALEEKVKNGELTKPDPDQLKKINRKTDLLVQIRELEKKL